MVRASKSAVEKSTTEKSVVAAPTVVPSSEVAAPVKKAKKSKVVEPTVVVEPVNEVVSAAPAVVEDVSSASVNASVELSPLNVKFTEFGAKLQQLTSLLSSLKSEFKLLEKTVSKNEKTALKNSHKKRKASGNRAPSGFVKPTLITDELATFLGKSRGTKLARTEVSKELNKYIREHSLQDKDNGRKIIPDGKLKVLLKLTDADELTYFNLQKFMKYHFIKETSPAVATA